MRCVMLAFVSVLSLAFSCNGSDLAQNPDAQGPTLPDTQLAQTIANLLPPFPLDEPARPVSNMEMHILGVSAWKKSTNTQDNGNELELLPAAGELSYAIYAVDTRGYAVSEVSLAVEMSVPDNCWLVFADYASQHWIIMDSSDTDLAGAELPAGQLRSPGGIFYCGLIASDGAQATVDQLIVYSPSALFDKHLVTSGDADHVLCKLCDAVVIGDYIYLAFARVTTNPAWLVEIILAHSLVAEPEIQLHWTSSVVSSGTYSVDNIDLACVDGLPALAWNYLDDGSLWYARALSANPLGPADWTSHSLDFIPSPGQLSLAEIGGRPAVAYVFGNPALEMSLRYVHATVPAPGPLDWTFTEVLATDSQELESLELAELNGRPAIAFNDRSNTAFLCTLANSTVPTDQTSWTTSEVFDYYLGFTDNRPSISLTEIDGRPAALYQCRASGLRFATADREFPTSSSHWISHLVNEHVANAQSMAQTSEGLLICCIDDDYDWMLSWLASESEPVCKRDWRWFAMAWPAEGTNEVPQAVASAGGTPMIFFIEFSEFSLECVRFTGIL